MERILLYFGLLAIGATISFKYNISEKLVSKVSKIQSFFLFLLIFVMGIRIGMDDQVISSIGEIGLLALTFALLTSSFSVLAVYIVRKKFIKDKKITGDK